MKKTSKASLAQRKASGQKCEKQKDFLIAGLGASAGGYGVFSQMLKNLPIDPGLALDVRSHKTAKRMVQQAKEFSDIIIQAVRQPLVVLDKNLNVLVANAAFSRAFNAKNKLAGLEVHFAKKMGEGFDKLKDHLRKVIKEQKGFENFELIVNRTPGRPRVLVFSGQPLIHKMYAGSLLLLSVEDITDRHETEEVREHLVAELEKLAHELEDRVHARTAELLQVNTKLQVLSARMLEAQELERRHLARELHDEIGQQITCLQILAEHQLSSASLPLKDGLKEIQNATAELLKTVRQLSSDLRPQLLDDFGVLAALKWHFKRFSKRTGIKIRFEKKDFREALLNSFLGNILFRVAQEALTNVARHARTNEVKIKLNTHDGICKMEVHDNGKGFNVKEALRKGSYGLIGMQERVFLAGGKLRFHSTFGKGTNIALEFPLVSPQSDAANFKPSAKLKIIRNRRR